jgi:hypothetical protein
VGALLLVERTRDLHLEQVGVSDDGIDGRPDLMAHGRQEVGLRTVGEFRFGPRMFRLENRVDDPFVGGLEPLREIACLLVLHVQCGMRGLHFGCHVAERPSEITQFVGGGQVHAPRIIPFRHIVSGGTQLCQRSRDPTAEKPSDHRANK